MLAADARPADSAACVPVDQCHGTAQVTAQNEVTDATGSGIKFAVEHNRHAPCEKVHARRLDELPLLVSSPDPAIELWHLDAEGAELAILRSATKLFANRRIKRLLFEYEPYRWRALLPEGKHAVSINQTIDEMRTILATAYNCVTTCEGRPFEFPPMCPKATPNATLPERCRPSEGNHIHDPWGRGRCVDVYCELPDVAGAGTVAHMVQRIDKVHGASTVPPLLTPLALPSARQPQVRY